MSLLVSSSLAGSLVASLHGERYSLTFYQAKIIFVFFLADAYLFWAARDFFVKIILKILWDFEFSWDPWTKRLSSNPLLSSSWFHHLINGEELCIRVYSIFPNFLHSRKNQVPNIIIEMGRVKSNRSSVNRESMEFKTFSKTFCSIAKNLDLILILSSFLSKKKRTSRRTKAYLCLN